MNQRACLSDAAPELLEALRRTIGFAANVADTDPDAMLAVKMGQAAINKALGR